MKITRADGNGQAQCTRCKDLGKWNRQWVVFLYKVDGKDGIYCSDCVKAMKEEGKEGESNV